LVFYTVLLPCYFYTNPVPVYSSNTYLEDFDKGGDDAIPSSNEVDCCVCCCWVGVGHGSHVFLPGGGFVVCSTASCQNVCCLECAFQREKSEKTYYCYNCYLPEISVTAEEVDNIITFEEIREELQAMDIQTTLTDSETELGT
jgi:hypothetical protein